MTTLPPENPEPGLPLGLGSSDQLGPNAQAWTCFHCGEVCTDADAARLHFGASEHQQPGCQIDLAEYRRMEEVNRRHCEEDTELHRALHRMECNHVQALRRAEEDGYAKGMRDVRQELLAELDRLRDVQRKLSSEVFAWRERFNGYSYRPQDDCLALGPNVEFSGVPAGHSSNHPAGGTSAGTQG